MIRQLVRRSSGRRRSSPWAGRAAAFIMAMLVVLIGMAVTRNARRLDALAQWRADLEAAAGQPAWPAWQPGWPPLPRPPGVRKDLQGPYAFAATQADLLRHIPCYCGCVAQGHASAVSCFVHAFRENGAPVWNAHSFTCDVCVHIAREVMLMRLLGRSAEDIRREIDSRYRSSRHSPTHTPMPEPRRQVAHDGDPTPR